MRELLLGIDLGTSSVKTALFDRIGRCVGSASASYRTLHPRGGRAEQEPAAWWQATCAAVHTLLAEGVAPNEIHGIGLSGQMHGTVRLDASGEWSNAIIWQDRRSAGASEAIRSEIGDERLIAIAGSPVAAGFQAATLRWLADEGDALPKDTETVLLPKDWLGWRMTGVLRTDPSDASGTLLFDTRAGVWSGDLLAAARIQESKLPGIAPSASLRGGLLPSAAQDLDLPVGTPVAVGGADTACALLAAGGVTSDTLLLNLSTGGQLVLPLAEPRIDPTGRLHTFRSALTPESGSGWYLMGATLAAGYALQWWREQALLDGDSRSFDALVMQASSTPPGCDGLLFLPYLVGERTPLMDPLARGAFLGLRDHHTQAHMTRAVLEGATFAACTAWQVMCEVAPEARSITLAGGGARSPVWRQIVADIFNLPVRPLEVAEQSAWGAALLAGEAVGWWQASEQAQQSLVLGEVVAPRRHAVAMYAELLPLFQEAYSANRKLFHALNDWVLRTSEYGK